MSSITVDRNLRLHQMFVGVFYIVWFPMLGRDFFLLAKKTAAK